LYESLLKSLGTETFFIITAFLLFLIIFTKKFDIMKRLLMILCLIFFLFSGWSQTPINLGIKFGTNSSSLITNFNDVFEKSEIKHYLAGAFVRVNLGKVYIQPEAYFNTKGGIVSSIYSIPENLSFQTIDVPLLIGYKIINIPIFNLRVHAGPVLSFVTADPIISDIKNLNYNDLKDKFWGTQAGIGLDLWFVTIDARIENSFNVFNKNSNYSASNRVFLLSAGIKLF